MVGISKPTLLINDASDKQVRLTVKYTLIQAPAETNMLGEIEYEETISVKANGKEIATFSKQTFAPNPHIPNPPGTITPKPNLLSQESAVLEPKISRSRSITLDKSELSDDKDSIGSKMIAEITVKVKRAGLSTTNKTESTNVVYFSDRSRIKVKVELVKVKCRDTEDVLEKTDELYLVGALVGGGITKAIATTPMSISTGDEKTFKPEQSILFEGNIPKGESIIGGIEAYDKDGGKDWSKYDDIIQDITSSVSTVLSSTGPKGALAGAILSAAVKGAGLLAIFDKDDSLKSKELVISRAGLKREERSLRFKGSTKLLSEFSDWNYTVTYRITRS